MSTRLWLRAPDRDVRAGFPRNAQRSLSAQRLAAAGFDCKQQTFFTWLGVVPYLTESSIWSTLQFIASLQNGAHVVFDYSNPPDSFPPEARLAHEKRAARVAQIGEAWLNYFETDELRARMTALGFTDVEDLGPRQIASRYFPSRADSLPEKGGHILRATTLGTR